MKFLISWVFKSGASQLRVGNSATRPELYEKMNAIKKQNVVIQLRYLDLLNNSRPAMFSKRIQQKPNIFDRHTYNF
jgi:hypothetical protein